MEGSLHIILIEIISDPTGHDKISDPTKMAISFQIRPKVWSRTFFQIQPEWSLA